MIPVLLSLWLLSQTAPDTTLDARTRAVAATLRCPACEDASLQDSPADLARDMRAVVREQLAVGQTPDQVRHYFVDRYGEWVLLTPNASPSTAPLWILPTIALAGGVVVVVVALRRWTGA
jgi:cytochrome c-type biogenesis protein CcmH